MTPQGGGARELDWLAGEPFGELVRANLERARRDLDGLILEAKFTDAGDRQTAWLAAQGIHVALIQVFHDLEEILLWLAERHDRLSTEARGAAARALNDAKGGFRVYDGRVTVDRGHRLQVAERMDGLVGLYRQVVETQVALARDLSVADAIEEPAEGLDPMSLLIPVGQLLGGLEAAVAKERT